MKIPFFKPKKEPEEKANPPTVMFADESSRGAINKATLPNFMLRPPFGVPRFKDVNTIRRLAATPQASMCKQTIIDEVVSVPWAIIPQEEIDEIPPALQNQIDEIEMFLHNPNTNNESFEFILRGMLNDLLDLDSGVWVKEFDESLRMVEIKFVDAATFLKNPDIFGKYTNREDIIPVGTILTDSSMVGLEGDGNITINPAAAINAAVGYQTPIGLSIENAREQAAYFQFGFVTNIRPVAFGKQEIVWFEKNPQSNQIYGKSPIENIMNVLQTLKYSIEYNLDYFEDNNVPKGFINMPGANQEELELFRNKWNDLQLVANAEGLLKKNFHRVPMTNVDNAKFERVQFTSSELQLIESQNWFSKIVWAAYGVTPSELGFTESSNLATEINQSRVFKRKAILPLLRTLEFFINHNVLSEWDFSDKLKFEFNTFNIEDETQKMELYKLQIDSGFKEVNEIRKLEGLDELEEPAEEVDFDFEGLGGNYINDPDPEESIDNAERKAIPEGKDKETNVLIPKAMDLFLEGFLEIMKKDKNKLLSEIRKNANDRLTQVKGFPQIINSIQTAFDVTGLKSLIGRITRSLFEEGIDNTEKLLKAEGIEVNLVSVNPEKVEFLSGMVYDNIKGLSEYMRYQLTEQIKMGISVGEGIGTMSERIEKTFDISKNRATMIARTESSRIETAGSIDAAQQFQRDGVEIKKWLLWTLDSRTSNLTKALHKKYGSEEQAIPLNKNFTIDFGGKHYSQMGPPFHPNERDVFMSFIVDKEPKKVESKNYDEFKHKYIRRTGRPGNYIYTYKPKRKPKMRKLDSQEELKRYAQEKFDKIDLEKKKELERNTNLMLEEKDTAHTFKKKNGEYTASRNRLHVDITKNYIARARKAIAKGQPKVVFMAGLPGSGKTFATKEFFTKVDGSNGKLMKGKDGTTYLVLNSDDIKTELPEYDGGKGAALVHVESSELTKNLTKMFTEKNVNLIIDGTMKTAPKTEASISNFKGAGYDVGIVYVEVPAKVAIDRVDDRYKRTGRFVMYTNIISAEPKIINSVNLLKNKVDRFVKINNTNKPRVVEGGL